MTCHWWPLLHPENAWFILKPIPTPYPRVDICLVWLVENLCPSLFRSLQISQIRFKQRKLGLALLLYQFKLVIVVTSRMHVRLKIYPGFDFHKKKKKNTDSHLLNEDIDDFRSGEFRKRQSKIDSENCSRWGKYISVKILYPNSSWKFSALSPVQINRYKKKKLLLVITFLMHLNRS